MILTLLAVPNILSAASDSLDLSDPFFNHEYSLQLALAYSGVPVAFPRSFFIFSSEDHTCFRTYLVMESLSGRPFTFGWEYPLSYLREFYHQDLSLLSFYDVLGLVDLDWKPQNSFLEIRRRGRLTYLDFEKVYCRDTLGAYHVDRNFVGTLPFCAPEHLSLAPLTSATLSYQFALGFLCRALGQHPLISPIPSLPLLSRDATLVWAQETYVIPPSLPLISSLFDLGLPSAVVCGLYDCLAPDPCQRPTLAVMASLWP